MPDTPTVRFESKMMIDGKLVDGEAGTFTNINPATEEVIGEVADASKSDMHRAIDAATARVRRDGLGFQSLVPPTLPTAAAGGVGVRAGGASRGAHSRSRVSACDHPRTTARRPAGRCAEIPGQADRRIPVGDVARRRVGLGHRCQHHAEGVARTRRRRRCDRAVELPVRGHHPEDRPGARTQATPSC